MPNLVTAKLLARPSSPVDFGCFVMPDAGCTVKQHSFADERAACAAVAQLARACKTLVDDYGLFYMDMKPANVAVSDGGAPVLLDYGAMCRADQRTGVTYPSPRYPEGQVPGAEGQVSYGLGVLLFLLLSAEPTTERDLRFCETPRLADVTAGRISSAVAAACRLCSGTLARRAIVSALVFQCPLEELLRDLGESVV